MTNKIEFTTKNARPFTTWLKRFTVLDTSLLLELDLKNNIFIAKSYDEQRSVVKQSKIKFDEAGLVVNSSKDKKRIKIGIYNISKLVDTFEHFNDEEFLFTITYDELVGDNPEYAALNLVLKNNKLKVSLDCTSLNIFKYISDDLFTGTISAVESVITNFNLSILDINKIGSLSKLDSDNKYLQIKSDKGNIYICSKTFELLIAENDKSKDYSVSIFKDQFSKIDKENYNITFGDDRLIFTSTDSDTISVVSKIDGDN